MIITQGVHVTEGMTIFNTKPTMSLARLLDLLAKPKERSIGAAYAEVEY